MSQAPKDILVHLRTTIALPVLLGVLLFTLGAVLIPGFASERSVCEVR